MDRNDREHLRRKLLQKKQDLSARLERINVNLRRSLDPDSGERAKQLEDRDVIEALGNEARFELKQIADTLRRMESDEFGVCGTCGGAIEEPRLKALPYATQCIECARETSA